MTVVCVVVLGPGAQARSDDAGAGAAANNSVDLQQPAIRPSHDPQLKADSPQAADGQADPTEPPSHIMDRETAPPSRDDGAAGNDGNLLDLPLPQHDETSIAPRGLIEPSFVIPDRERKPIGQPRPDAAKSLASPPTSEGESNGETWWSRIDPRSSDLARVLGALGLVVGLIIITRILLRRAGHSFLAARRPSGVVEILARYPIGRGEHIMLLKLVRRVVLLHRAGSTMTVLTEIADPDEVAMLLARVEAGSSSRHADQFHELLDRLVVESPRGARRTTRSFDAVRPETTEVVDLTRSSRRAGRILGLSKGGA
jgi:flagellar biogenesis protein FliO